MMNHRRIELTGWQLVDLLKGAIEAVPPLPPDTVAQGMPYQTAEGIALVVSSETFGPNQPNQRGFDLLELSFRPATKSRYGTDPTWPDGHNYTP